MTHEEPRMPPTSAAISAQVVLRLRDASGDVWGPACPPPKFPAATAEQKPMTPPMEQVLVAKMPRAACETFSCDACSAGRRAPLPAGEHGKRLPRGRQRHLRRPHPSCSECVLGVGSRAPRPPGRCFVVVVFPFKRRSGAHFSSAYLAARRPSLSSKGAIGRDGQTSAQAPASGREVSKLALRVVARWAG